MCPFQNKPNGLVCSEKGTIKGLPTFDLLLSPQIFKDIFNAQILQNLSGDLVLKNQSCFSNEDFIQKQKVFGTMSLSYDPLVNYPFCGFSPNEVNL